MHTRLMIAANIALVCVLMGLTTGCKSKKSQVNDAELANDTAVQDVTDESGKTITGARFEDMYKRAEGVSFAPVYFAFDSYALAPNETAKIEQVAKHLQQNSSQVLVVEGHCDERGSNEYNLALGENRAIAVRTYLTNLGVTADRIQTRSFGSEKPAIAGTGEAAWKLNRRGEFAVYQK